MAIGKPTDLGTVRPLDNAIIRRFTVGAGGVAAGDIVTTGAAGVVACDGNDATYKSVLGIAIKSAAVTEKVDVVVLGGCVCVTGATVGTPVYPDDTTAGLVNQTASTNKYAVGLAESATVIFVSPRYIA